MAAKVPVEVWTRIGDFFTSPCDLISLASISPQAMSAAADLARYPWVLDFRLVDVVGSVPPIPETTESTENQDIRCYFYEMGRAKFTAVSGGRRGNVQFGQYDEWSGKQVGIQAYIWDPTEGDKLYVSELDDDEASGR